MKNLLIIGFGIVGQAVHAGLENNNNIDIIDIEPSDNIEKYHYDGIILCLPTPKGPTGECDDMLVEQYIRTIRMKSPDTPILIKSTISIELIELLKYDKHLTYNPEFLTEVNSVEQFKDQKFAIFGGDTARFWFHLFINSDISIRKVRFTSLRKAGFAKYAINSFLATKVIFFNELKQFYSDSDFDELTDLINLDKRIGDSHMMVPGPDMKHGFGGKCLPKDTLAFITSASRKGSPLKLLEKAIDINKELRNEIKE
jgi:UDPglucose 6-dehydrogenase